MKDNVVSQWMSSVLIMLDCTWLIYLLEVNSSIQYSSLVWTGTSSSCWPGCISGISPSCLHGDHGGHASEPIPKDGSCDILLCSYVLILQKACTEGSLCIYTPNSQCAANAQELLDICLSSACWSSSACWRHPKRLTGWLCASRSSQWATHSFSSASIAVAVGRSSSQNFMQLRCYILQTWLQLQKVDWDQAESKLIKACSSLRLVWHKWTFHGLLLGSLVPCGSRKLMVCIVLYARHRGVQ